MYARMELIGCHQGTKASSSGSSRLCSSLCIYEEANCLNTFSSVKIKGTFILFVLPPLQSLVDFIHAGENSEEMPNAYCSQGRFLIYIRI